MAQHAVHSIPRIYHSRVCSSPGIGIGALVKQAIESVMAGLESNEIQTRSNVTAETSSRGIYYADHADERARRPHRDPG